MKEFSCPQLSCLGPGTLDLVVSSSQHSASTHSTVHHTVMAEKLGRVQWDPRTLPNRSPTSRQVL